jgi:hypothetical protein
MSASYFATLFETGKWIRIKYLRCTLRGETNTSLALAPVFINDPSKYIVQYSYSVGADGVALSVHSATKSIGAWDLIASCGA